MFATLKNPSFLKIYIIPLIAVSIGAMSWSISIIYALDLGADILQINLITTIRSTMSILLLVPFGILSDRFGRKPMIIYPRVIMLLGTLIRTFATDPNHLILAAVVGGFAGGSYFPILLSMIGDIAEPGEQRESISILFLFSSIGMVLGPLITTLLLTMPQITLRGIYQITAVAEIGVLAFITTQIRETKPQTSKGVKIEYLTHIKNLISKTNFRGLMIMASLYFFNISIVNTYTPIYGRVGLNLSNTEIASFSFYRNLAIMLIRFSSATFLSRIPITPFLLSVLALAGITGFASSFANNYISMVVILFLSGISFGAVRILTTTIVAKNSTPENRGIANSLLDVSQATGNLTKILTSSTVIAGNFGSVFILGGITGFSAIIPVILLNVGH